MPNQYCASCGSELIIEAKFCSSCGAKVELRDVGIDNSAPETSTTNNLTPRNFWQKFWIDQSPLNRAVIVLGLATIAFSGLQAFYQGASNSSSDNISSSTPYQSSNLLMSINVDENNNGLSCSESMKADYVYCTSGINIKNTGDVVKNITGYIYARVDGKVFKATTIFGGLDFVSSDINPGEVQSAIITFEVPANSIVSDIYIASSSDPTGENSPVGMPLNEAAIL
jgi:hypothetical protein